MSRTVDDKESLHKNSSEHVRGLESSKAIQFVRESISDPLTAALQQQQQRRLSTTVPNRPEAQTISSSSVPVAQPSQHKQFPSSSGIGNGWELTIGTDFFGGTVPKYPQASEVPSLTESRRLSPINPLLLVSSSHATTPSFSSSDQTNVPLNKEQEQSSCHDSFTEPGSTTTGECFQSSLTTPSLDSDTPIGTTKLEPIGTTKLEYNYKTSASIKPDKRRHLLRLGRPSSQKDTTGSTFSTFTQNIVGHARDLGSLAKNAATTLLNTASANVRTSFMDETSLDIGYWREDSSTCIGTPLSPVCYYSTSDNENARILPNESQDVDSPYGSQLYPFDERFPYFGLLQYGWYQSKSPFHSHTINTIPYILRCNTCRFVYIYQIPSTLSLSQSITDSDEFQSQLFSFFPLTVDFFISGQFVRSSGYRPNPSLPPTTEADQRLGGHIKLYPNEDVVAVLVKIIFSLDSTPCISGKLICTNYRMVFEPDVLENSFEVNLGTQWTYLANVWELPLAFIDSITQCASTLRERAYISQLMGYKESNTRLSTSDSSSRSRALSNDKHKKSHSNNHEVFVIHIVTKDNRRFRVILKESGREFQILATLQSAVFPSTLFDLYAFKVKELPSFMDSYTTTSLSDPTLSSMSSTTKSFPTNVNQTNNTSVPLTIENIQKRPNTAACNGHGIFQNGNRSLSSRSLYGLSHSLNYCSKDLDTESIFAKPSPRDKPECRFTQLTVELYDPNKEWEYFITLSSQPNCMKLRISNANSNFALCPSYPRLVVVPEIISDKMLFKIASFRSKRRFPIFCWMHRTLPGSLWRSSQPRSMFNRCVEDEEMLSFIAQSSASNKHEPFKGSQHPMLIVDARPYANACANKMSGGGFEGTSTSYPRCRIEFANIHNIHHVRDAWRKMCLAISMLHSPTITFPSLYSFSQYSLQSSFLTSNMNPTEYCPLCYTSQPWITTAVSQSHHQSTSVPTSNESNELTICPSLCVNPLIPLWVFGPPTSHPLSIPSPSYSTALNQISSSAWYDNIQCILKASNLVVSRLSIGESVLIHCSDGWDRTAQLSSLAMICLDPYYRSIEGFIILIEQEFLYAGHQFHLRCGHPGIIPCKVTHATMQDQLLENSKRDQYITSQDDGDDFIDYSDQEIVLNEINSKINSISEINYPGGVTTGHHLRSSSGGPPSTSGSHLRRYQQRSPIFIQWLDCVFQIMRQFPTAFEFKPILLDIIASALTSCLFGTFLLDCQREREYFDIKNRTYSLWSRILQHRDFLLRNSSNLTTHFNSRSCNLPPALLPSTSDIEPWYSYWLKHKPNGLEPLFKSFIGSTL